jgi:hypothetical protein
VTGDLYLRRKWTLRAHGEQVVLVKKHNERAAHVLMKAFLWALYLPEYPDAKIEIPIGDRYKPDVISLRFDGRPRFWGEAGHVGRQKVHDLVRRFRDTHFAFSKWDTDLDPFVELVQEAVADLERSAPVDLLAFPADSAERYIDGRDIHLTRRDLDWIQIGQHAPRPEPPPPPPYS